MNELARSIRYNDTDMETEVLGEKLVLMQLFPPQISHGRDWN
jgi:hypothetical protein